MKVAAVKKPGGPGNLVIEDRPDPKPKAGEILVRIHASSLNYHDFVVVMGGSPQMMDAFRCRMAPEKSLKLARA